MEDGDDWEIDEDTLGPDFEGVSEGVPLPIMRATHSNGRLTILPSNNLLDDGTIGGMGFATRSRAGVTIMELGETESEGFGWELTVGYLAEGERAAAERAIATWAGRVGYRRVWLPDSLFEPAPPPPVRAIGSVTCPTCRHRWHGRGRRFWRQIWSVRLFPSRCPICGGDLPQWGVRVPADFSDEERANRSAARRRTERIRKSRLERQRAAGGPAPAADYGDGGAA